MRSGLAFRPVTTTCRSGRRLFKRGDHLIEWQIVVTERDVELVENDETEARIVHQLDRLGPSALGRGDVAGEILRLPGEALAHGIPGRLIAELRQRIALSCVPGSLDELHDADTLSRPSMRSARPKAAVDLPLPVPV